MKGEVWIDRPAEREKAAVERRMQIRDVLREFPDNRQGKRAALRKLKRLGLYR